MKNWLKIKVCKLPTLLSKTSFTHFGHFADDRQKERKKKKYNFIIIVAGGGSTLCALFDLAWFALYAVDGRGDERHGLFKPPRSNRCSRFRFLSRRLYDGNQFEISSLAVKSCRPPAVMAEKTVHPNLQRPLRRRLLWNATVSSP